MTLFFGNVRLVQRLVEVSIVKDYIRLDLHSFGLEQFKNFWFFGYGNGAFEQIFKLFYILPETIPNDYLARHVHNDGIELLGEVGVVGVSIFAIITIIYFKKLLNNINEKKQFARFILLSLLVFILFIQSIVDYSLHIPGIQVLLITIFSMGLINFKKNDL
jgi:O-antigen ligase